MVGQPILPSSGHRPIGGVDPHLWASRTSSSIRSPPADFRRLIPIVLALAEAVPAGIAVEAGGGVQLVGRDPAGPAAVVAQSLVPGVVVAPMILALRPAQEKAVCRT